MRKKKLIPLATFILIALLIIGASTFYFKAREEKVNQTNVTNDITKEEKKNEEENKEEQSVDDSKVNSNDEVTNSKNDDVSLDTNNSVTNKNTTSNESKKQDVQKEEKNNNKKTNDNSSSVSNSQPVQPTQPTQPTCTPKKFDMNWVRADFNTFEECKNIGDKYMDSYGYYCDSYQDSCGTTYYMLTLFDTNGNLFDYHSVQIP
jgi:FtsZ-interacting cell division protein ZipA